MEISLEDAYREACSSLGEEIVRQRFLYRRIAELEQALQQTEGTAQEGS